MKTWEKIVITLLVLAVSGLYVLDTTQKNDEEETIKKAYQIYKTAYYSHKSIGDSLRNILATANTFSAQAIDVSQKLGVHNRGQNSVITAALNNGLTETDYKRIRRYKRRHNCREHQNNSFAARRWHEEHPCGLVHDSTFYNFLAVKEFIERELVAGK